MVTKVVTTCCDDIDGAGGARTYRFSVGSHEWEIDLSDDHYRQLMGGLRPFMEAGRKIAGGRQSPLSDLSGERFAAGMSEQKQRAQQLEVIRSWAQRNGFETSGMGRIPKRVMQAYEEANGGLVAAPTTEVPPAVSGPSEHTVATPHGASVPAATFTPPPDPVPVHTRVPAQADARTIRSWWKENQQKLGLPTVREGGRIPADVKEMWQRSAELGSAVMKAAADEDTAYMNNGRKVKV